jgi:hypothetical protein
MLTALLSIALGNDFAFTGGHHEVSGGQDGFED